MKALSGKAFARVLERHGWRLLRVKGSHHVYGKEGRRERITIPLHGHHDLKAGAMRKLMTIAGLTDDDLS